MSTLIWSLGPLHAVQAAFLKNHYPSPVELCTSVQEVRNAFSMITSGQKSVQFFIVIFDDATNVTFSILTTTGSPPEGDSDGTIPVAIIQATGLNIPCIILVEKLCGNAVVTMRKPLPAELRGSLSKVFVIRTTG